MVVFALVQDKTAIDLIANDAADWKKTYDRTARVAQKRCTKDMWSKEASKMSRYLARREPISPLQGGKAKVHKLPEDKKFNALIQFSGAQEATQDANATEPATDTIGDTLGSEDWQKEMQVC